MISLISLMRSRNGAVLTPGSEFLLVRASRPLHSFPFGPLFHAARLDGLGGGGFGGRGDGGRSRDWHTAEALGEVHDAIMVRVLIRWEELLSEQSSR